MTLCSDKDDITFQTTVPYDNDIGNRIRSLVSIPVNLRTLCIVEINLTFNYIHLMTSIAKDCFYQINPGRRTRGFNPDFKHILFEILTYLPFLAYFLH